MVQNLTNTNIRDTYVQLLHLDGGPAAEEKPVLSALGETTALKVGTGSASVGNVQISGNTISTLNADGGLVLAPNGAGTVTITNVAFSDAAQAREALGLGDLAQQTADDITITGGSISGVEFTGAFTGITAITSTAFYTDDEAAGLTLSGNDLLADGTDPDIDINLTPKGTGAVKSTSIRASNSLGFAAGSGGTVTQLTSRTTSVTLNAPSGQITLVAGSIAGLSSQEFTLNNTFIEATDVVLVTFGSGLTATTYDVTVTETSTGACKISLHNVNNSATPSDTPVLNFVVIKGVNS